MLGNEARYAADDAEVARLMEEAPDTGEFANLTFADSETGDETKVSLLAFNE